ncbi:urease accessory protein UreE [Pseudoroseicyclus sp. CXY001]|uniref:urease accessory protein UreE n=1 Tax=Pseudoroseicyclus sp. CXY001 TaxID=3242492 RepID=UPI003570B1A4
MTDLPPAHAHLPAPVTAEIAGRLRLTYDERLLRRKRLETEEGARLLVDLPATVGLAAGDGLALEDGRAVLIEAADEPLMAVRGGMLVRLAWHIGNRHTPCQIESDRLVLRHDKVLRAMLEGLGAEVTELTGPFTPEGGAYGGSRVMGHDHGGYVHGQPETHGHDGGYGHEDGHGHSHSHDHGHGHGHEHDHGHDHSHDHGHDHSHAHRPSHDPSHGG